MRRLKDIVIKTERINISNNTYYRLLNLKNILLEEQFEYFVQEDIIILPYYIFDKGILELYDYELNIRVVDNANIEEYILKRTGKNALGDVEKSIVEKFQNCYIALKKNSDDLMAAAVLKYIKFVFDSKELKDRLCKIDENYDFNKIYFEFY